MICPRWVFTRVQPIAIQNVLDYLMAALESPETEGRILEVGGRDVLTYAEMMTGYARARRLKRWLVAVPVLTPRLSSYWVHLITPIPARIAQPLIKGLGNGGDCARRNGTPTVSLDCIARLRNCRSPGFKADGDARRGNGMVRCFDLQPSPRIAGRTADERGNDYGAATMQGDGAGGRSLSKLCRVRGQTRMALHGLGMAVTRHD